LSAIVFLSTTHTYQASNPPSTITTPKAPRAVNIEIQDQGERRGRRT
jgi:hypothetical protein